MEDPVAAQQQQQRKLVPPKLKLDLSGLKQSENTNSNQSPGAAGSSNSSSSAVVGTGTKMAPVPGLGLGLGLAQGQGLGGITNATSPKNTNTSPRYLSFAGAEAAINNMDNQRNSNSENSEHSKVETNSNKSSRTGSMLSVAPGTGSNSRNHSMLKVDTSSTPLPGLAQGPGLGGVGDHSGSMHAPGDHRHHHPPPGGAGGAGSGRTPRDEKPSTSPVSFVPHLPSDPKPNRRSMLTPRLAPRFVLLSINNKQSTINASFFQY